MSKTEVLEKQELTENYFKNFSNIEPNCPNSTKNEQGGCEKYLRRSNAKTLFTFIISHQLQSMVVHF